jgi:hypothetical protein
MAENEHCTHDPDGKRTLLRFTGTTATQRAVSVAETTTAQRAVSVAETTATQRAVSVAETTNAQRAVSTRAFRHTSYTLNSVTASFSAKWTLRETAYRKMIRYSTRLAS